MKKILLSTLIIPFFAFSDIWVDYDLSEDVVELTVVQVEPNRLDDYLVNLEKTWVAAMNLQKELGFINDFAVWTTNEQSGTKANVLMTVNYSNISSAEPNKERDLAFAEAWEKMSSEQEQDEIVATYPTMRKILAHHFLRRVTYK